MPTHRMLVNINKTLLLSNVDPQTDLFSLPFHTPLPASTGDMLPCFIELPRLLRVSFDWLVATSPTTDHASSRRLNRTRHLQP
jgi:hypothetical protein